MDFSPETIFISYSRKDGRNFAEAFERRLEQEAGIVHAWRDLKSVEGGEDIRPQVLRAIERVKHFVLILSRRALESDWVKREWTHARKHDTRTLRLHDNMIWYLRDRIGLEGFRAANESMVRALLTRCRGDWTKLPADQVYGWRFLIQHLRAAGRGREADVLLVDYAWIRAKLGATRPFYLFDDYLPESANEGARLVGLAIALSLTTLVANPRELPRQIFGRLGDLDHETAKAIVEAAKQDPGLAPRPRWPGLTHPGAERLRLIRHYSFVNIGAFSPDGARVVTASADRTARLWDAARGHEVAALPGHECEVTSIAFSPEGGRVVTASVDNTARVWDAATGHEIAALRGHEDAVDSAAFSPDGARIVTASDDYTARIWDAATGREIANLNGHEGEVTSAVFSPGGDRVVTASGDDTARVWDTATGHEIANLSGHEGGVTSAAFSPDGARIVTASDDYTARIWDAATGREIAALNGHEGEVTSAVFSPHGGRVVTASADRTARIWDAATGREIATLSGHEYLVRSAAFSPNGDHVVTAGERTARLWGAATGQEIAVLRRHEGGVKSVAFSPDGAHIVTASFDKRARVCDAVTGLELASIALDAGVTALSVADGVFALGDALGRIHVFEAAALFLQKADIL